MQILQLALGVGLLVVAFRIGRRKLSAEGGRITRWRESAMSEEGSTGALMSNALDALGLLDRI